MSRIPKVERDAISGGITIDTAIDWYTFLADEAYFEGDALKCSEYTAKAESLKGSPQGYLRSVEIENAIRKWGRRRESFSDHGPCNK